MMPELNCACNSHLLFLSAHKYYRFPFFLLLCRNTLFPGTCKELGQIQCSSVKNRPENYSTLISMAFSLTASAMARFLWAWPYAILSILQVTWAVNGHKRHYFSCRRMLLSKSHHLVSILKTESQDKLTMEARVYPADVHAESNKPGMESFAAPVLLSTEQT